MRIVHVINSLATGGAERLVVDLASEQTSRGHDVSIVALTASQGVPQRLSARLGIPVRTLGDSVFDPRIAWRLPGSTVGYDVVHVHLFPSLYWSILCRQPKVFTEHSTQNRRMSIRYLRPVERLVYARYSRLVTISDGVKRSLSAHLNTPRHRALIQTVDNGIGSEFFTSASPARRSDGGRGMLRLIAVGSLRPVKNHALALDAVARTSHVSLDIAGEGPLHEELLDHIRRNGLEDRVRLLGTVDDMPTLLLRYDALLCTSTFEGFSLASAEALACGLPVIGPAVEGLDAVLTDGLNSVIYSRQEASSVADAISRLQNDGELVRLKSNARESVKRFSIEDTVSRYLEIYNEALGLSNWG